MPRLKQGPRHWNDLAERLRDRAAQAVISNHASVMRDAARALEHAADRHDGKAEIDVERAANTIIRAAARRCGIKL